MTLRDFNYPVQAGVRENIKAKINNVQFDGGYSQRSKKGIHNRLREFSVSYVGTYWNKNGEIIPDTETEQVLNFLDSHEGYKTFNWTSFRSPYSKSVKVFCDKWDITYNKGSIKISMSFHEVLA